MMSALNYCRFCAEETKQDDLAALKLQDRSTITEKLSLFGSLVNFSDKKLPETMCIKCSELIDVFYDFILKVKKSQVVLSEICCMDVETEASQDDVFNSFDIKEESDHQDYLQDEFQSPNIEDSIKEPEVVYKYSREAVSCLAESGRHSDGFHEFVAHVHTHREELRKYCEYCNMKLEDPDHPHTHTHTCTHCGQCFTSESSLVTHLHTHRGVTTTATLDSEASHLASGHTPNWTEYPFICKFCELKMADGGVLRDHCVEVHRRCFGRRCADCDDDDDVTCFDEFVDHVRRHRPFLKNVCPFCNSADKSHDVKQHTADRHVCPLCGHSFPRKRDLLAHQAVTQPPPLKPPRTRRRRAPTAQDLTCGTCGRVMKTPVSLRAHLKTHFARKRNFTCENCGKAYFTKGTLDAHRKIHENTKNETCKICQKTFLTIPRLKKHVKTHNLAQKLPFQCDQCKRCFGYKDRLREHVKVHMSVMPYKCEYCAKTFRRKTIMRSHERQHTGARPYACNLCTMEFANWSNCNKHMKRRHGTTLAQHAMTPHGKLALNPATGRPDQLHVDTHIKEWAEMMLMGRDDKIHRKNKMAAITNSVPP